MKQNRRQSVRVNDRVLFSCQPVPVERYNAIEADSNNGISLYNQPGLEDVQIFVGAQSALGRLREKNADLAEFLHHLDNKLNMVMNTLRGEGTFDTLSSMVVSLSGNGISFPSDKKVDKDESLEFHLVLLPKYVFIYCLGKVVSCTKNTDADVDGTFQASAEFSLIMDDDREKLIQHSFKQQSLALRRRRENNK